MITDPISIPGRVRFRICLYHQRGEAEILLDCIIQQVVIIRSSAQQVRMATTMQAAMGRTAGLIQQRPVTRSRAARMVPQAAASGGNSEGIWLPGVEAPKRLEGLIGNRGFDPFNFAVNPSRVEWYDPASLRRYLQMI